MGFLEAHWDEIKRVISIIAIAFLISRIIRFLLARFVRIAARKLKIDPTNLNFFKNGVDFLFLLIAIIVIFHSIPSLRTFGNTLLTGAGVLAAIVGFASQSAFANIISGIFLVIFRPFSVGDRVRIGQLYTGDVEDITLRHTVIKDFENRRIVIPNSVISNETIINSSLIDEKVTMFLEFTIPFDANLALAKEIIRTEAEAHPYCIDNRGPEELGRGEPPVMVRTVQILDYGIVLRGYAWAANPSLGFEMRCELQEQIKKRFDADGIQLAVPVRAIRQISTP